jgi:hypothetical protein
MIYLSLIPYDKKFLFILTESTAKDPSGDIVDNELTVLKETLGAKSLNNYVSASISYRKIDNSKRDIRHLTFKYFDKITGEIKTGIEDTLTSTGYTEETKFIRTDDDLFALDLDPKYTHIIAHSLDNELIAYIYVQDLITSLFRSDKQYLHDFVYKVAKRGFID